MNKATYNHGLLMIAFVHSFLKNGAKFKKKIENILQIGVILITFGKKEHHV